MLRLQYWNSHDFGKFESPQYRADGPAVIFIQGDLRISNFSLPGKAINLLKFGRLFTDYRLFFEILDTCSGHRVAYGSRVFVKNGQKRSNEPLLIRSSPVSQIQASSSIIDRIFERPCVFFFLYIAH